MHRHHADYIAVVAAVTISGGDADAAGDNDRHIPSAGAENCAGVKGNYCQLIWRRGDRWRQFRQFRIVLASLQGWISFSS
jgi:hypothetical protein